VCPACPSRPYRRRPTSPPPRAPPEPHLSPARPGPRCPRLTYQGARLFGDLDITGRGLLAEQVDARGLKCSQGDHPALQLLPLLQKGAPRATGILMVEGGGPPLEVMPTGVSQATAGGDWGAAAAAPGASCRGCGSGGGGSHDGGDWAGLGRWQTRGGGMWNSNKVGQNRCGERKGSSPGLPAGATPQLASAPLLD
jgi:hypothetical protein